MLFCDYKIHVVPFFISSTLLPLDHFYFTSVAILMHDVSNNTSPPQISNLFNYKHLCILFLTPEYNMHMIHMGVTLAELCLLGKNT